MSRLIVVIMEENEYPFGQCDNSHLQKKKVMVRKRVQFHPFQKKNMLLKAKKLKSFNNQYIIKLQQLLEQDSSFHLLFQYVPIKIQTWISNINSQFIENFRLQLLELAQYLAENSIVIDFKLRNIGMDQNYHPKYFIGLDYEINPLVGKDHLNQKYSTQINQIINPYRDQSSNQQKTKQVTQPNPQFMFERKEQTLKRENQKSIKNVATISNNAKNMIPINSRSLQIQAKIPITSQRDSIKKISQVDMKLTFNGNQKPLLENLPKNISTNIKIQNIGKKINDLRNLIHNMNGNNSGSNNRVHQMHRQRKHDSISLSPMKSLNDQRPNSSYQKGLGLPKQFLKNSVKKQKNEDLIGKKSYNEHLNKELRQTQSQNEYSGKLTNNKKLNRMNEKKIIDGTSQSNHKNEVRVIGSAKQSYIYEFERLLDDDIDQFAVKQVQEHLKIEPNHNLGGYQSPRFGVNSEKIEIENHKTQPQRFSYSHTAHREEQNERKRKKSTDSASSNRSNIQQRVNAVIGASKKLINNFKKSKASNNNGNLCNSSAQIKYEDLQRNNI